MSPVRVSKYEIAMRLALDFHRAINDHDLEAMLAVLSDNCRLESPTPAPDGAVYNDKASIGQYYQEFFQAFSQSHFEIEEIFGYGERCIKRWVLSWVDASGDEAHLRGLDLYRVQDGQICEVLSYVKG